MGARGAIVAAGVAAAIVVAGTREARADVFCKKKKGAVVVRSACKSKETALNLADFGALGPAGPRGPSFGQSAYKLSFFFSAPCNEDDVLTLPIEVTEPVLIYASANGIYEPNGSPQTQLVFEIQLRTADNTTTLATAGRAIPFVASNFAQQPISLQGVVAAPSAYDASATPFVASPGSYMLNLRAGGFNGCSGQSLIESVGLSYILLGTS